MKEVKYENLVKDSWLTLKKNPILLVPGIIMFVFSIALVLFYLSVSGILNMIANNPEIIVNKAMFHYNLGLLLMASPFKTFLSSMLYVMLVVMFDAFFITMKYGMIKDAVQKIKPSLKKSIIFGIKHYIKLMGASIVSMVILLVPLSLFALIIYKIKFASAAFSTNIFGFLIMGFIVIIGLVYAAYIIFRLLFLFPVMFLEEKGIFSSIKKDFHYVKANVMHTLISWFIVLVVLISYSIITNPLSLFDITTTNIFIVVIISFFIFLIENIVSVWNHLFIFKSYMKGKG